MRMGAFVVIFDERRRVLLCHRRDIDVWNLPGGGVEDGEAPWDAAVREAREEVGVEVEIVRLTGLYWKPERNDLVFNFEGRIKSGIPTTSDEANEVGYFAVDEIPANMSPLQLERIHDAEAGAVPVFRSQMGPSSFDLFPATAVKR
ncbi:MAG: NUDIX domain-containing protein [Chloroflexi bacterium]|nr:MAG: NUDIX domain-containing protein [Chloroflexota bacterium]